LFWREVVWEFVGLEYGFGGASLVEEFLSDVGVSAVEFELFHKLFVHDRCHIFGGVRVHEMCGQGLLRL
jgi:hypothetical protein